MTTPENVPESRWASAPVNEIPSTLHLGDEFRSLVSAGGRIIDLGCGTGMTALELGALADVEYTGIDINESAIVAARDRAVRHGLPRVTFEVRDARSTGLEARWFDLAIMQALLTVLESPADRATVLREARRLLRPSGRLYVADFLQAWDQSIYRERYLDGRERFGEDGTFLVPAEAGHFSYVAHHFSEREFLGLLSGAGFESVHFSLHRFGTRSGNQVPGFIAVGRCA